MGSRIRKTTSQFINDAVNVHGNKYGYSKVLYKNNRTKVIIECYIHGFFLQTPDAHINKKATCKECAVETRRNILIKRANKNRFKNLIQPEDYKLVPLTQGKFAIVDNEDFDRVKSINWSVNKGGYAISTRKGLMHRFIMNPSKDRIIDHKDRNTLNNRKENLRICGMSENSMNSISKVNSKSIYKGVYWIESRNKWKSLITLNQKTFYIGYFKSEIKAAKAYDKRAIQLFGEFALLNFPNK